MRKTSRFPSILHPLSSILALWALTACGQLPTNNLPPASVAVTAGTNGVLAAPANFFSANGAAISAAATNVPMIASNLVNGPIPSGVLTGGLTNTPGHLLTIVTNGTNLVRYTTYNGGSLSNLNAAQVVGTVANATNAVYATSSGGAPPTGAAGGSLGGNYPNPTVTSVNAAALPAAQVTGVLAVANGGTGNASNTNAVNLLTNDTRQAVLTNGANVFAGTHSGNGGGLTNLAASNVVSTFTNTLYQRFVSPAQTTQGSTYTINSGNGMFREVSSDLVNWYSVTGTNSVFNDPQGKGPHDPSVRWDGTNYWLVYTKQSTAFADLTNGFGIAKSSDGFNWTYLGVVNFTNSNFVIEAPEWFADANGSNWVTTGCGFLTTTPATAIYSILMLDGTGTNWSGNYLIATNTGYMTAGDTGLEDSFCVLSNTTYRLYVANQATHKVDTYTNNSMTTLFTREAVNILGGGQANGCDPFYANGQWYFFNSYISGSTANYGQYNFYTSSSATAFTPVSGYTYPGNSGVFCGEYPASTNYNCPPTFGQSTVLPVPANHCAQVGLALVDALLASSPPNLYGLWQWGKTNGGSLVYYDDYTGLANPHLDFAINPYVGAPASALGNLYLIQGYNHNAALYIKALSGQYGPQFILDGTTDGGGKWQLISAQTRDGNAGDFYLYNATTGATEFDLKPGTSGNLNIRGKYESGGATANLYGGSTASISIQTNSAGPHGYILNFTTGVFTGFTTY